MTLYAIGDIQGCYRAFESLLDAVGFDPSHDRLWLVGDLVNRGPESLAVLRRVIDLGEAVTTVLGNHDLHLLAAAAGLRRPSRSDTFQQVLDAPDAPDLLDWLRGRPLLHREPGTRRVLVHAGVPPGWSIDEAQAEALEVEAVLRGAAWREDLAGMYGNEPAAWSPGLSRRDRLRYTINALTRMRYCDREGRLDLQCSGPPGSQPEHLMPWFDVPHRAAADDHIVFGHWSALGLLRRPDITALDTGCVWGRTLTAIPLADPLAPPISIRCA